jgi:sirohydrochlorin ferrochelatase
MKNAEATGRMIGKRTALLLIAHGSRESKANADLEHTAELLRTRGEWAAWAMVSWSYLELAKPDIAAAAAECVEKGADVVLLVPYFLSAGLHVTRDLENARRQLSERFPQVEFKLAEPLGPHPLLAQIVAERAEAARLHPLTPAPEKT